jgi:hypothetical protein
MPTDRSAHQTVRRSARRLLRTATVAGVTVVLGSVLAQPASAERGDGRWGPGGYTNAWQGQNVSDRITPPRGSVVNPDELYGAMPPRIRGIWEMLTPEQRRQAVENYLRDYEDLERRNSPQWGEPGGSGGGDSSPREDSGSGASRPDTDPDPRDEQRSEQQEMNDRPDTQRDPRDEQREEQREHQREQNGRGGTVTGGNGCDSCV